MSLVGPEGLLNQFTKDVFESALEAELTEHLGHGHGQTLITENTRNATQVETVLKEIGREALVRCGMRLNGGEGAYCVDDAGSAEVGVDRLPE